MAVAHAHKDLTPVTALHGQQLLLSPDGAPRARTPDPGYLDDLGSVVILLLLFFYKINDI